MTLISSVNWKQSGLPHDYFKGMWFMDQVYVIRKPEVFNGWICEINPLTWDSSNPNKMMLRTSDGEFIYDFDGNNPNFEVEYLGKF